MHPTAKVNDKTILNDEKNVEIIIEGGLTRWQTVP
jgi:hypothetical protein